MPPTWSGVKPAGKSIAQIRTEVRATAPNAHLQQLVHEDGDFPKLAGTDTDVIMNPNWGGWHPDHDRTDARGGTRERRHHGHPAGPEASPSWRNLVRVPRNLHGQLGVLADMIAIYRIIGVAGPVEIASEWFDNLTLLPHGPITAPFNKG